METKTCLRCKQSKSLEEFSWNNKSKGTKHPYCKQCKRSYENTRYRDIPEVRERTKNRSNDRRRRVVQNIYDYLFDYLLKHPCPCGEDDITVLEFHHRDPSQKDEEVTSMATRCNSLEKIKLEVSKCDVLCVKCHRKLTPAKWKLERIGRLTER